MSFPVQAINCLAPNCHPNADGIPAVTDEIARVLPGTTVLVDIGKAVTRVEARTRAAAEAKAQMTQTQAHLAAVRQRLELYAAYVNPAALVVACLWVGVLSLANVRARLTEVGVLRTLGVGTGGILRLFLGRAALAGLAGAPLGGAIGLWIAARHGGAGLGATMSTTTLAAALLGAPALAMLAAWLPALRAAQQDPAVVLADR